MSETTDALLRVEAWLDAVHEPGTEQTIGGSITTDEEWGSTTRRYELSFEDVRRVTDELRAKLDV